ncbi:hypothetical protein GGER_41460 [Serratia rubidaea]
MTFIELFKRLPIISGLAILGIGAASQALAAPMPGTCVNTKGTKDFYFPFDAQYTDPENNRPGVIIHDASKGKWNLYEGYIAECGCDNMIEAYFTAESLLRAVDAEVDGWTYYVLNEYLSVASAVTIAGGMIQVRSLKYHFQIYLTSCRHNTKSPVIQLRMSMIVELLVL